MSQSLDGYGDHDRFPFAPSPELFRQLIDQTRSLAGSLYGRRLYELMRYWDDDQAGWVAAEREFALAWRAASKWVASKTLETVGPNAKLLCDDIEAEIDRIKLTWMARLKLAGHIWRDALRIWA